MKQPKKPTLKQLKKRPALWQSHYGECVRISYPNGDVATYDDAYGWFRNWISLKDLLKYDAHEFVGWL